MSDKVNWVRLGELIELCDERNGKGLYGLDDVVGISTEKKFILTKANLEGVSLSSYKVVNQTEFVYVADTSRRGDKIAIAINNKSKPVLISSIYTAFRCKDNKNCCLIIFYSISEYKKTNKVAAEKYEELLQKKLDEYHDRRKKLSSAEATETQKEAVESIIANATQQALDILKSLGEDKESFRKLGLTFEEKAFYDILIHLRDSYNFEYGEDENINGIIVNDRCKQLAKKIKNLIDTKSSFANWLNNENIKAELNQEIWFCLQQHGYPPEYNDDVFNQVMEQVENYKTHH